jgi:hypothetical protein
MVAKAQYLYSNFATFTCFSAEKACKGTTNFGHTQVFLIFFVFFLHICEKSSNFAAELRTFTFCYLHSGCLRVGNKILIRNLRGRYISAEIKPVELEQVMLLKKMKKVISRKSKVERQKTFFFVSAVALAVCAQTSAQENADTLSASDFQIQEVVVSAPVKQATVSRQEIRYEELNRDNTGQNLPVLLSNTPSLVTTSDDGLGVGYTYFRVRGSDHTRINMTINEVPLNDAESQTVFWVNMTDISSSITKLDVQRGIGTSANGGSSFGASINISTIEVPRDQGPSTKGLSTKGPVQGELSFNGGMYNTFREMAKLDAYWGERNS